MSLPLHYRVALNELGQREIKGPQHNARIVAYQQATRLAATDDETPWCAAFVNWCLEVSGQAGTQSSAARSFLNWGQVVDLPQAQLGDVIVFARGVKAWQGHVGFFAGLSQTGLLQVLGGNQGDAVSIIPQTAQRLLGLRRLSERFYA